MHLRSTLGQVEEWLPSLSGIIVNTRTPIDRNMMERARRLKFIGRLGVGLDIFDEAAADELRIALINTPGANANAVGEHVFGMLLGLIRHIPEANESVKSGQWLREKHRGRELGDMTVGLIGCGNTGRAFASKFGGWMTKVLTYDKYKTHYVEDLRFVTESSLEEVIELSDVISLHVPLTNETKGMVDAQFLSKCKDGVIIINASRGRVVDLMALVDALEDGKVSGACLDVLPNEKLATLSQFERDLYDKLYRMDNVILTPHIAGWTYQSRENIARQMLNSLQGLN